MFSYVANNILSRFSIQHEYNRLWKMVFHFIRHLSNKNNMNNLMKISKCYYPIVYNTPIFDNFY